MDATELMTEIIAVHKKMDFSKIFNRIFPFNSTEFQMMKIIMEAEEKQEPIISSDVARSLGITRSAVSQMVKKLEERHVLVRETNENDKKSANLRLSPAAREYYDKIKDEITRYYVEIVDEIGYDNMVTFLETYLKIVSAIYERRSDPDREKPADGNPFETYKENMHGTDYFAAE